MAYRYIYLDSPNMPTTNMVMATYKWPTSCRTTKLSPKSSPKTSRSGVLCNIIPSENTSKYSYKIVSCIMIRKTH